MRLSLTKGVKSRSSHVSLQIKSAGSGISHRPGTDSGALAIPRPPGITNTANNCFASCIFQCLLSHPTFVDVATTASIEHQSMQCPDCKQGGNLVMIISKIVCDTIIL